MEILKLPLEKHFVLITDHGFSTFMVQDPHNFVVQDLPLRFVINLLTSDPTDKQLIADYNNFFNIFKYNAMKFFGSPILADITLKEVLKNFEIPLAIHLDKHAPERKEKLIDQIRAQDPIFAGKEITIQQSPLFVFTRNGLPDR